MDTVVLGAGRESTNPAVVASCGVKVNGVGEDCYFAALVDEVLALDEFVIVGTTSVREDFEVSSTRGFGGVAWVAIRLNVRRVFAGDDVPGSDV